MKPYSFWLMWKHANVVFFPRCSMYRIFTYIWVIFEVNVGRYSIHGAYGFHSSLPSYILYSCSQDLDFDTVWWDIRGMKISKKWPWGWVRIMNFNEFQPCPPFLLDLKEFSEDAFCHVPSNPKSDPTKSQKNWSETFRPEPAPILKLDFQNWRSSLQNRRCTQE